MGLGFNVPKKANKKIPTIHRTIVVLPGSDLYPYCFDQKGIAREKSETINLLFYAPDYVIDIAMSKGIITKTPLQILEEIEEARKQESLNKFIHKKEMA